MVRLVTVPNTFHARVIAARLGAEGMVTDLRGNLDGPYPMGDVHIYVGEDDLADAQDFLTGAVPIALESPGGVARVLLDIESYDLGLDYLARYPGIIRALTREQVQAAARRYLLPERVAIAVAGPGED